MKRFKFQRADIRSTGKQTPSKGPSEIRINVVQRKKSVEGRVNRRFRGTAYPFERLFVRSCQISRNLLSAAIYSEFWLTVGAPFHWRFARASFCISPLVSTRASSLLLPCVASFE